MAEDVLSIAEWVWFLPSDIALTLTRKLPSLSTMPGLDQLGCRDLVGSVLSFAFWLLMFVWWRRA